MRIQTINVITIYNGVLDGIISFVNDEAGIKEAKACFSEKLKDTGYVLDDEDIEAIIKTGYFDSPKIDLYLTVSEI